MTLDYVQIGANIRSVRQERKISQAKLSEYTNLSTAHISHIESGKTKVSLQSLSDIADALGTTLTSDDEITNNKCLKVDPSVSKISLPLHNQQLTPTYYEKTTQSLMTEWFQ